MPHYPEGTKREILELLRMSPSSVSEICDELDLSQTPVREHLYALKSMDLVDETKIRDGPGRPTNIYRLTDNAEEVFPKEYAEFANMTLEVLRKHVDEETIRKELKDGLTKRLLNYDDLMEGLKELGTYPTIEEHDDGTRTLIFHQCPFLDVAQKDDVLCDVDQVVLESMNGEVDVETTIARGGETCVFHLE